MRTLYTAAIMLLALSGCVTSEQPSEGTSSNLEVAKTDDAAIAHYRPDDTVCKKVVPVGSHIPQTRCYKRSQLEAQQRADRQNIRRTGTPRLQAPASP